MRALLIAAVIAVGVGAPGAQACSLPVRQPGESQASADDRLHRDFQARLWADSEVVFVGELSSIVRERGVYVEVVPIASLKGEVRSDAIGYPMDQSMLQCGAFSWPTMEAPGVYFANRDSDGELRLKGMLTYDAIRDQTLFNQFNEHIGLEPIPLAVRDGLDAPPTRSLPSWGWLVGTAGLSLLVGLRIGRTSRKASNRQKPPS